MSGMELFVYSTVAVELTAGFICSYIYYRANKEKHKRRDALEILYPNLK